MVGRSSASEHGMRGFDSQHNRIFFLVCKSLLTLWGHIDSTCKYFVSKTGLRFQFFPAQSVAEGRHCYILCETNSKTYCFVGYVALPTGLQSLTILIVSVTHWPTQSSLGKPAGSATCWPTETRDQAGQWAGATIHHQ